MTFDGRTKNTIGVKNSQIDISSLYDLFVEIIILPQDVDFNLNVVHNDSKRLPIIWHSL